MFELPIILGFAPLVWGGVVLVSAVGGVIFATSTDAGKKVANQVGDAAGAAKWIAVGLGGLWLANATGATKQVKKLLKGG